MSDAHVAALMKGEHCDWSPELESLATAHGALPLIAWRHGDTATMRTLAAHDAVRQYELAALFDAFGELPVVVVKGEALARTHYAHSWLRPRCDADLLIERDALPRAAAVLTAAGYALEPTTGAAQQLWRRVDRLGIQHTIDLHFALSNRKRYADVLPFAELWSRGIAIRHNVRMPSPADALLIAAVHLTAHHSTSPRLIWLYDIHLLHASMTAEQLQEVARRARERKAGLVLDAALALAVRWFGDGRDDSRGRLSLHGRDEVGDLLDDLRCTPGVRRKLRLVREHLFPPAAYMLHKYAARHRAVLPALYVRRAVGRLLRRRVTARS
jgi:Uncharacterised nucleotidyltransferase